MRSARTYMLCTRGRTRPRASLRVLWLRVSASGSLALLLQLSGWGPCGVVGGQIASNAEPPAGAGRH